jgi:hypothetical protein
MGRCWGGGWSRERLGEKVWIWDLLLGILAREMVEEWVDGVV